MRQSVGLRFTVSEEIGKEHLVAAVHEFASRDRRFGGLNQERNVIA